MRLDNEQRGRAQSTTLTLTNCTLTGNTGVPTGGGIANFDGTATLTNSTLTDNTADDGGGIYDLNGATTLQNTILAPNTAPNASLPSDDCFGVVTSLGTNLIGDSQGCTIMRPQGGSDLTGDPGLDTFTDDGTPGNGHFPLLETSQAIDAGDDDICPDTDQLGQPRVSPHCDIGAIEFQPSDTTPPVVTIVSVTPDTLSPPNGRLVPVTIVATITDAGSGVDPARQPMPWRMSMGALSRAVPLPSERMAATPLRFPSRPRGTATT